MKKTKQIIALLIILSMVIAFIPFKAFAEGYDVTIGFKDGTVNGNTVSFTIGESTVNVTVDSNYTISSNNKINIDSEAWLSALTFSDNFNADTMNIKIYSDDGFQANYILNEDGTLSRDGEGGVPDSFYFVVEAKTPNPPAPEGQNPSGPQGPGEPGPEQKTLKFDFRLNGVDVTNWEDGNITVPADFNMDEITEFYIKKIVVIGENGTETYNYNDNEYSYSLLDDQGRKILETNFEKVSDNYVNLRVLSHEGDIQDKDKVEGRIYYGFYLTGIKLVKSGFKGVEVSTSVMPDNYDFTGWNGVDLSETTKTNPGKVTAYYGEDTISFDSIVASNVRKISLVTNSGVPSSAVSIDNTNKTVKVLSNYYNEIPLEIELEDGTKGYITVDRIGIFVDRMNVGNKVFYHGASADVGENMNVDTDKNRVVAVFYHEDTKTYNDYDLIVNMVFKDGSTKTAIAKGVGDVHNSNGNIVGSDYILWASATEEEPVEVYVTAVSKNALSDSNTFGGATFGSGAGVKWVNE